MTHDWLSRPHDLRRRRATAAIPTALVLILMLAMVALTTDIGHISNIRLELQATADSAVLGAAHLLPDDHAARVMGQALAQFNHNGDGVVVHNGDIRAGHWSDDGTFTPGGNPLNAVWIATRRNQDNGSAVPLTFASIFGYDNAEISAIAVARRDTRFGGIDTEQPCAHILPLAVDIAVYNSAAALGNDEFAYDEQSSQVSATGDGYPEFIAYPGVQAATNLGLLNIGISNFGATSVSRQILNGITPQDILHEIGSTELLFYNDAGEPLAYDFSGNYVTKASLESRFSSRIGDIVGIFLHDNFVPQAPNGTYHVVGLRFVRVMNIVLQDGSQPRGMWLQPLDYECHAVIINQGAPPIDSIGRVELVH